MRPQSPTCFGYRVRAVGDGWRWTAFDEAGGVRAEGLAPSRAAAAAEVIRALAATAIEPFDRAA